MTVPTQDARVTGGTLLPFVYQFIVEGTGGAQLVVNGLINVICSVASALVFTEPSPITTSILAFMMNVGP